MSDEDGDVLVMSGVDNEAVCDNSETTVQTNYENKDGGQILSETRSPDDGWEVVGKRKNCRKEQIFKNKTTSEDTMRNKNELSILDKLTLHLQDQKVVPVDQDKANKSLQYLREQWQDWAFGRVIRIQGMYAFFYCLSILFSGPFTT